jgi:hypothetical protein
MMTRPKIANTSHPQSSADAAASLSPLMSPLLAAERTSNTPSEDSTLSPHRHWSGGSAFAIMQGPLHASPALAALLGNGDWEDAGLSGLEFLNRLVQLGHLSPKSEPKIAPRERWHSLLKPAVKMGLADKDPWSDMAVHDIRTEIVKRWDYDASTRTWTSSETLIKMERTPFAHGAMRECFRMKKMSQVRPRASFWSPNPKP